MLIHIAIAMCLSQCPAEFDQALNAPGGLSGTSVSIDGDVAVIGSPLATGTDWASGMVLVYRLIDGVWTKEAELVADDIDVGDMMGVSVDVSGNRVIAGAWFEDHAGSNSGAAYIFEISDGNWSQVAKLTASDAGAEDTFGRRVAILGDTCIVTSPLDDDNGSSSGAAYVFQFDKTWQQTQKLVAKDGASGDQFGLGLGMDEFHVVVGSPWAMKGAGQVHVFNRSGNIFTETQTLTDLDGHALDNFGFGVDVSGDWLMAGSYHDGDLGEDAGSLFVYVHTSDAGFQFHQQLYSQSDKNPDEQFGVSVAVEESVMIIGHRFGADNLLRTGTASVYDFTESVWEYRTTLVPTFGTLQGEFGWSVAIDGNNAIVGAPFHEPDGYAELFVGMTSACECIADISGDGIVGVTDLLSVIAAWGTCVSCDADLNGDGIVNVSDLLTVISLWGNCPSF